MKLLEIIRKILISFKKSKQNKNSSAHWSVWNLRVKTIKTKDKFSQARSNLEDGRIWTVYPTFFVSFSRPRSLWIPGDDWGCSWGFVGGCRREGRGEGERDGETGELFFEQISWSPAMPKFMTSLPKLESQKQRKRTQRSSSKGKAAQLLLRPFFRRRAAMP